MKLRNILAGALILFNLSSCNPPKLKYSGIIDRDKVNYLEQLIYDEDNLTYDTWSNYEFEVFHEDGSRTNYFCVKNKGNLILEHMQVITNGDSTTYHRNGKNSELIELGQREVDYYISEIKKLDNK